MGIEKEIDEIFLHKANKTTDDVKIKNLQSYTEKLEEIKPHLSLISEKVKDLKTPFQIYNIQLEALAKDLEVIQDKNNELEEKLTKDKMVFEKLTNLVSALNIDESHLQVLDNGSFLKTNDLVKMQEALSILSGFDVENFTLRVVQDVKQKVVLCQRNFYKRFVNFLNKSFIKTESTGELKVHKDFYTKIKQYDFIFNNSKNFEDCFELVFGAYILHSKKLYDHEFKGHLKTIEKLLDDEGKLGVAIEILFKSYKSLLGCELNFISNLMQDEDIRNKGIKEIFKNVNVMLFDFIDELFKKSRIVTIISLSSVIKASEEEQSEVPFLKNFDQECKRKFLLLQDLFIKDEEIFIKKTYNIAGLTKLFEQEDLIDLKTKMFDLYIERISKRVSDYTLSKLIDRYKLIYTIQLPPDMCKKGMKYDERKEFVCEEIEKRFEKKLLDEIFETEKINKELLKKIVVKIKQNEPKYKAAENKLILLTKEFLLPHVDDKEKHEIEKLLL